MINPQETINVAAAGMVYATVVSVFAQALGVMMIGAPLTQAPAGRTPTKQGLADLRATFGPDIVGQALKDAGEGADITQIAMAVEGVAMARLEAKYGKNIATKASASCPPLDWRCVRETAQVLYGLEKKGITTETHPAEIAESTEKVKAKGKRTAQPVKDTKTGIVYHSKASAGMAVAPEYDLDPKNHFVWYEILKLAPDRFVRVQG